MSYAVQLEKFEGPLDLLLECIENEAVDISDVSLALITDRYLAYLHDHPAIPPEEMADFLVVASKLLFLKSKTLLPFLAPQEDEGPDLAMQLKMYKAYVDASKTIAQMLADHHFLYAHESLPRVDIGFAPPEKLTGRDMRAFFAAVIARLEPLFKIPKAIIEQTVSLHEKIKHIQAFIRRAARTSFRAIAATSENKTDIVVSFLALLELMKQKMISVHQQKHFADITIEKITASL